MRELVAMYIYVSYEAWMDTSSLLLTAWCSIRVIVVIICTSTQRRDPIDRDSYSKQLLCMHCIDDSNFLLFCCDSVNNDTTAASVHVRVRCAPPAVELS